MPEKSCNTEVGHVALGPEDLNSTSVLPLPGKITKCLHETPIVQPHSILEALPASGGLLTPSSFVSSVVGDSTLQGYRN